MKPAYFHYLDAQDPLNEILDHYVKKRELTAQEAQILRERAIEKEPRDDRVRRLARALLALSLDSETTNDYPLTQALRRLRARKRRDHPNLADLWPAEGKPKGHVTRGACLASSSELDNAID